MLTNYSNKLTVQKILRVIILLVFYNATGQSIKPDVTARGDTSKTEKKEIYQLYKDYLNCILEKGSANQYWNKNEAKKGVGFCNTVIEKFRFEKESFTYYIMNNSDELGKLFNFEYLLS